MVVDAGIDKVSYFTAAYYACRICVFVQNSVTDFFDTLIAHVRYIQCGKGCGIEG